MDKIREELADVRNYCILMADVCGLDLDEIVLEKVKRNALKYPVEKAFGSKEKYTEIWFMCLPRLHTQEGNLSKFVHRFRPY